MAEYRIDLGAVRRCCLDPDRVWSKRLTGEDRLGLAFARDFDRGTLEVICLQQGSAVVVITAYWFVPGSAPLQTRRRHG